MVKKFKALGEIRKAMQFTPFRIYTDVAGGPFWTLAVEHDYNSLDEFREHESRLMAEESAREAMAGYHELLISGHREIYKIET